MTKVMICGARKRQDIDLLVDAGVDAIGLITEVWQNIPCNLSRTEARELSNLVPPFVSSVLILTEETVDEICRIVDYVLPDFLQLHGFNSPQDVAALRKRLKTKIIKTLHFHGENMAEGGDPVECARHYIEAGANAILLDSYQEGKVGATGETMSIELARRIRDAIYPVPVIMSGGLHCENVTAIIKKVKPYAVDVFSGVTTSGYLDAGKVRWFIARAKEAHLVTR